MAVKKASSVARVSSKGIKVLMTGGSNVTGGKNAR